MKILMITGLTLPEVTEEELAEIYVASGEGELELVHSNEDAQKHLEDAEIILGVVNREMFPKAKSLRWLHSTAAGADMLMYPEMVASDVVLTGEKGLVGDHLSDHAFALLLALTRQLKRQILEAPKWIRAEVRPHMLELSGFRLGVVGLGGTGRAVARRAKAFGMDVIAVDSEKVEQVPEVSELQGMDRFHDFLGRCNVVVVCCPLTKETRGLFNDAAFAAMQPSSYIVNVTRGPIIDDQALLRALESGKIAGAGLDVVPQEPLPAEHPFWKHPSVVLTPHTAGASQFRARRNVRRFIENIKHYRAGEALEGEIDKNKGY